MHENYTTKRTIGSRRGLIALSMATFCGTSFAHPEFGIDNESDYQSLVSSMRAAEYVRADSINAQATNQRVFAAVAGVMAFAEINPDATDDQLALFLELYNIELETGTPGDPMLKRPEHLISAIQFTLIDDAGLDGLDPRIGERALALLGITIPDPDGFESIQRRMVRYETALARPVNQNRTEVFDLLVQGFFGQDPSGTRRTGLPEVLSNYLISENLNPALGQIRADRPAVESGLDLLPQDFVEYQSAIVAGPMNDMLQSQIQVRLESVSARIDAMMTQISASADTPLSDGLDVSPSEVEAMFAQLQAELEANNEARAAASAATMIMLQSQFNDIEAYATYTRDYSSISLESNDTFAAVQASIGITNHLTNIVLMSDDGAAMIDNTFGLITESLGLASFFGAGGPSVEDQIFDQIVELRQQVEELRQEMHVRFDRIDQQLNIMYDSMLAGFHAIGNQIGDLQTDVDGLILDMASTRSALRRLEASLYGVAEDILLTGLTTEANIILDYRDENGVDLPYSGGSPDFITASESFFTYANVTALSEAFAGSRSHPTLTATNADDIVGSGPISRRINDLAVLPQSFGLPALTSTDLVGIEPWSQAAAAYSQLARENPWYFAYRYNRQLADYNTDPQNESLPELDRTIVSGDRLVSFIQAVRTTDPDGSSPLFDALVAEYKESTNELQLEIDALIAETTPSHLKNQSVALDFWGDDTQSIEALLPTLGILMHRNDGSTYNVNFAPGVVDKGYRMFTSNTGNGVNRIQIWHLLQNPQSNSQIRLHGSVDFSSTRPGDGTMDVWLGSSNVQDTHHRRLMTFKGYTRLNPVFPWQQINISNEFLAEQVFNAGWNTSGIQTQYPTSINSTPVGSTWINFLSTGRADITTTFQGIDSTWTQEQIMESFYSNRSSLIRPAVLSALFNDNDAVSIAADRLDNAVALINAYVSIAMSKELDDSHLMRSALRASPGASEFGLRRFDVIRLISDLDDLDSPNEWADPANSLLSIDDLLNDRIDIIHAEIEAGLQRPIAVPGYIRYMLGELTDLRDHAFELAIDDRYKTGRTGRISISQDDGLLVNDVNQEFTTISVDTEFELDPAYIAPQNGRVRINADGSFTYRANSRFSGTDWFTYRTRTTINGTSNIMFSDPAMVVIDVAPNLPCSLADFAIPYGKIDFIDLSLFLEAFRSNDSSADLNGDTLIDIFDVHDFLISLNADCL